MIESDTQRVIERTYRPGKVGSKAFLVALIMATREIVFFVTHGHHAPSPMAFDFGDDGKAVTHE